MSAREKTESTRTFVWNAPPDAASKGIFVTRSDDMKSKAKKIKLNLSGLDANAFSLMGAFVKQAHKEGWTREEIDAVLKECKSGDFNHLLQTLDGVCKYK